MSWFWDEIEKENARKQAEQYEYIDNPNKITWISIGYVLILTLVLFGYCPMSNRADDGAYAERQRDCYNNFYKYTLYGIVKGKEYRQSNRTHFMTFESLSSNKREIIDCNCPDLYEIYGAVEIGDTILKPIDTLLVKIYNAPKYEELNRYETFREK